MLGSIAFKRAAYLLLLVSLSLCFANFAIVAFKTIDAIKYPYELDYGEGPILSQALMLGSGINIYKDINVFPYVVTNYPPLFHLVTIVIDHFNHDMLESGRLVGVFSAILISILIFAMTFYGGPPSSSRWTRVMSAGLAGLLFFSSTKIDLCIRYMRVDTLSVALSFLGFFLFTFSKKAAPLYFSGFALALAGFAKQNAVAAPLACLLIALASKDRHALKMLLFYGIAIIAALGILEYYTRGEFLKNIVEYNVNAYSFHTALWFFKEFLLSNLPFVLLLVTSVLLILAQHFRSGPSIASTKELLALLKSLVLEYPALLYLVLAFMFAFQIGKTGSSWNYFIEWYSAACLVVGAGLRVLFDEFREKMRPAARFKRYFTVVAAATVFVFVSGQIYSAHAWNIALPNSDARENSTKVYSIIHNTRGPVLSEDMTLLALDHRVVPFQPFIMTQLTYQKIWTENNIIREISAHLFKLIVVDTSLNFRERFSPDLAFSIVTYYRLKEKIGRFSLFVPDR